MQLHGAFLLPARSVALSMAIVKILARHSPSYGSLIRYQLRYVLNDAKADEAEVYTQNLRSTTIAGYVREFVENEAFRRQSRSDQVYLFHEIVSFHAQEDNSMITRAMLDDLVGEYFRLRGETGVMLAAVHRDREHVHIHCCVSALEYRTGKSFALDKAHLRELKQQFQEYHREKYPQLTRSFPEHGRGNRHIGHAAWHKQHRAEIADKVRNCFTQARTQNEFLELLRTNDLHHYERNGKPTGIEFDGSKFRFSRLLGEGQAVGQLPIERSEEEQALEAIRAVRARQVEREIEEPGMELER